MDNSEYIGNVGLLFNKIYFSESNEELVFQNLEMYNKLLVGYKLRDYSDGLRHINFEHCFKLQTVYPGLLCGSGYAHDIKQEEAFKIGFFFDHTTGLPVIPGSSVKGVLRNAFPGDAKKSRYHSQKAKYIYEILKKLEIEITDGDLLSLVSKLELEIFEGKRNDKVIPIKDRDKFYEAIILSPGIDGLILGDDTLCPHGKDPLKNPIPLSFLKVLPMVIFKFNFDLRDSLIIPKLNVDNKLKLFKQILLDFGAGAKTNVGYGQFIEPEDSKKNLKSKIKQTIPNEAIQHLKANTQWECEVSERNGDIYVFRPSDKRINGCIFEKKKTAVLRKLKNIAELRIGSQVIIQINADYAYGSEINFALKKIVD